MPRISERKACIEELENLQLQRTWRRHLAFVLDDDDDDDSMEDLEQLLDLAVDDALARAETSRYLFRDSQYRRSSLNIFQRDLAVECVGDGGAPWLNPTEFLEKYRVTRDSFHKVVELIESHQIFQSSSNGNKQAPVEHQLMVLLHYLGCSGSGASNQRLRNQFGIGRGTSQLYKDRVVTAVRSLREKAIYWPNEEEGRRLPSESMSSTIFQTVLQLQMGYYFGGFPGSVHDSRVYNNTALAKRPQDYFGDKYYLIGDGAFENSPSVVSCFKAPRGLPMPPEKEQFNSHLARLRITCRYFLVGNRPSVGFLHHQETSHTTYITLC